MNNLQIQIADEILKALFNNGSRLNTSALSDHLTDIFDYKSDIDISYVLDVLTNDYQLITPLGQAWLRLTLEGERAYKIGISAFLKELHEDKKLDKSVKTSTVRSNYFNISNIIITIAASIISTLLAVGILKLVQ